jgi:hypothetical protein
MMSPQMGNSGRDSKDALIIAESHFNALVAGIVNGERFLLS